jgi:NTE family protein
MRRRALILGSGGLTGIAWEVGVLRGLEQSGFEAADWDLVVGSSAGAFVGTQLLGGCSLDDLLAAQVAPDLTAQEMALASGAGASLILVLRLGRRRGLGWLPRLFATVIGLHALVRYASKRAIRATRRLGPVLRIRQPGADTSAATMALLGDLAVVARPRREDVALAYWEGAIHPVDDWPKTRLLVTAIDAGAGDGERSAWDGSAGVPLARAVAASAAVPLLFAPITVGRRRYIDSGSGSQTNADLARGFEDVLVSAHVERGRLAGEVEALAAAGSRVVVIRPGPGARRALGEGLTLLDPARRAESAQAGLDDGTRAGRPFPSRPSPGRPPMAAAMVPQPEPQK